MELIVVRHTSVAVEPGVCYGHTDVALRDSFEDEAHAVSEKIDGLKFDGVFTSPLSRCRRLTSFLGYSDAVTDSRLSEMNFGDWEMQRFDEISDPRLQQWYDDYLNVAATSGESWADVGQRVADFMEMLRSKGLERVLLLTHGGVIMHLMLMAGMATIDTVFSRQPGYGSVTTIKL